LDFGVRKVIALPAIVILGCLLLWGFWWEPSSLQLNEECLAIDWPLKRPLRVAILADLHVGSPFNGVSKLEEVVRRTNSVEPDLVFIPGDLVIQGVLGGRFVAPETSALELAKLKSHSGVFGVLGNHDRKLSATRVEQALRSAGVEVLEDRSIEVVTPAGRIWVAGVSDFRTAPHNVRAALAGVTSEAPLLVITHNPDVFPQLPDRINLTIAGHTHGGQVRIPLFGSPIVPSKYGQRFAAGHIVEGGRHLFVSTGIGTSIIPVRFRVPPAISVLTLTSACNAE
jgi:predicted MPP superfamily phosphohydrolase